MENHPSLNRRLAVVWSAALLAAAAAPPALALTRGATSQGRAFLAGGVGRDDVQGMEAERDRYSLWIITAARLSGAYLADVELSITNEKGVKVFERKLEGPWLMIDLPLGRYEVQARMAQESQSRVTTIHPGDHHQMVLYFSVDADVLPKR